MRAKTKRERAVPTDHLRDVDYVGEKFDKSAKWVYRHAAELGGIKVGGSLMFTDAGLEDYLRNRRLIPSR